MKKILKIIGSFFAIIQISTASELMIINTESQPRATEYYSTFSHLYQNINPIHNEHSSSNKIKVLRGDNGKITSIEWLSKKNLSILKKRIFTYDQNGLLRNIAYMENNILIEKTIMGKNKVGKKFFSYIFSPAFNPREYNYFTKTIFEEDMPIEHKILSMNNHPIGKIMKEYDENKNLIHEIWYRGKSNIVLREFTIKFNQDSQYHELMEIDKNGNIIRNQIALTN